MVSQVRMAALQKPMGNTEVMKLLFQLKTCVEAELSILTSNMMLY